MTEQLLYIDPGSGNLLLQFIIAGCLGVIFFFKNIGYAVKSFFGKSKNDHPPKTE
jgi:hypothetical protein